MTDSPWLDDRRQRVWRQWLRSHAAMQSYLAHQLTADDAEIPLSLPDFEVLVGLSEAEDGRRRLLALADMLTWERSRLSHHVTRMEKRGLVERRECPEDGRGAFVVITELGRAAIEAAAPGHVRAVRRTLFDLIDEADLDALDRITAAILEATGESVPEVGGTSS